MGFSVSEGWKKKKEGKNWPGSSVLLFQETGNGANSLKGLIFRAWENCTLKQRKKTLKGTKRCNFLSISLQLTSVEKRFEKEKVTRDETTNSRFWDLNFKTKKIISIVSHPISNEIKSLSILLQFFNYSLPKSANLIIVWSYTTYIYISKHIYHLYIYSSDSSIRTELHLRIQLLMFCLQRQLKVNRIPFCFHFYEISSLEK